MTTEPGTILILVMPLAPLLAGILVCTGDRIIPRAHVAWPVVAGCLLSGTAAAGLLAVQFMHNEPPTPSSVPRVSLYRWYGVNEAALTLNVTLRTDPFSLFMIVAASLATTSTTLQAGTALAAARARRRDLAVIAGVQFATVMLLAADNLVQIFIFWQFLSIASWLLVRNDAATKPAMQSAGRVLLVLVAGDLFLLAAIVICGSQLHTLSLPHLTARIQEYLSSELPESVGSQHAALLGLTGFLIAGAVVVRCGLFPAFGWLTEAGRGLRNPHASLSKEPGPSFILPDTSRTILVQAIVMPLGGYLVIRLLPLLAAAPDARWMLLVLGSLTCALAAAVAVCERDATQILLFTTASQLGLLVCGVVDGSAAGWLGAVVLWIIAVTARMALLLLLRGAERRGEPRVTGRVVGWLAVILLVSGLGGQHAVLTSLCTDTAADTTPRAPLAVLIGLGMLLTAAALVRLWVESLSPSVPRASVPVSSSSSEGRDAAPIVLVGAAFVVTTWSLVSPADLLRHLGHSTAVDVGTADPPVTFLTLLLAGIGAVAGWLFGIRRRPEPPQRPALDEETPSALVRLARRRFYIDEVFFLLLIFPIRALAQLMRFFEWLVVDGVTAGLPRRIPRLAARWTRPLDSSAGQFAALAIVLAATVLLIMLIRDG